jgi:hypothetical protein
MKKLVSLLLLSTVFMAGACAQSTEVRTKQFNVDKSGLAIEGYDPVAYFTSNKAIVGKKDLSLVTLQNMNLNMEPGVHMQWATKEKRLKLTPALLK